MAAPTPVSALVHSSTLVTAGVFLLIRFNVFFRVGYFSYALLCLRLGTLLISRVAACFEIDLKKVVALSTLSQISIIMISLCCGLIELGYFHIIIHALFKAMLFLCVGVIIHGLSNNQDLRLVGGIIMVSPVVGVGINIANLALIGFPFLAGFYSKDLILESLIGGNWGVVLYFIIVLRFALTVCYSFRLSYYLI
ncbi:NADH dehydrogenase subunit 5 [Escherichia coli]|nr:NADH dehydrogenase subunit 5 [Escherichia coli]